MKFAQYALLTVLVAVAAFSISGCGSGGSGLPASYPGQWNGTWTSTDPDAGSVSLIIFSTGGVSGVFENNARTATADLAGRLDYNGRFEGSYTYRGGRMYYVRGKIDVPVNNTMNGTLDIYEDDSTNSPKVSTATITLHK